MFRRLSPKAVKFRRGVHVKLFVLLIVAGLGLLTVTLSIQYSPSVSAQDPRLKIEQDLEQVFTRHEDLRLNPQMTFQQVKTSGQLHLATLSYRFDLQLEPNDLRAPRYRSEEVTDGVVHDLPMLQVDTYKGTIDGVPGTDARFTVDATHVEGMIMTGDETFFVEAARKYSQAADLSDYLLYKSSDVRPDITRTCGDTLDEQVALQAKQFSSMGKTAGLKIVTPMRVVELATEADDEYVSAAGGSSAANQQILGIMNQVDAIYRRDVGLTFSIVFQHTWSGNDPYTTSGNAPAMLNEFTNYWNANITNARDDAHMWTGRNMGGPAGIAWQGVVCRDAMASYGMSDRETISPFQVGIPAHEIGHNFGATHPDQASPPHTECDNTIMVSTLTQSNTLTFCQFSIDEMTNYVNANSGCLGVATLSTVQFSSAAYPVSEGDTQGHVTITVTRLGDTSGAATVNYRTTDTDTFTVGCGDTVSNQGSAYGRCDYATVVGTLSFAAGEVTKSFVVPIIDDSYHEVNETFNVVLTNPLGATLGTFSNASVTIVDDDVVNRPNPILETNNAGIAFFVRQHYLDFLGREPEVGEPWSAILRGCGNQFNTDPASPSAGCDRITVSGDFFGSPEFKDKGVFVIDYYRVAFNRLPQYSEFVVDLASISGTTASDTIARRAAYANNFVQRAEFSGTFGLTNSAYVSTLMSGGGRYNLSSITTPDPTNPDASTKVTLTTTDLTNRLNAGTLTKAQVLRAIVQSDQIVNIEAINVFVSSQYYGYLRRTPDTTGFNGWVNYMTAHPADFRTMVNGFVNSQEYRLRFGPA